MTIKTKKKSRFDMTDIVNEQKEDSSTKEIQQYISAAVNSLEATPQETYTKIIQEYRAIESDGNNNKYITISRNEETDALIDLANEMPEVALLFNSMKRTQVSAYFLKLGLLAFLKARADEKFEKDLAEVEYLALRPSERALLEKQMKRIQK